MALLGLTTLVIPMGAPSPLLCDLLCITLSLFEATTLYCYLLPRKFFTREFGEKGSFFSLSLFGRVDRKCPMTNP